MVFPNIIIVLTVVMPNFLWCMDGNTSARIQDHVEKLKKENSNNVIITHLDSCYYSKQQVGLEYLADALSFFYEKNKNVPVDNPDPFNEGKDLLKTFFSPQVSWVNHYHLNLHDQLTTDLKVRKALLEGGEKDANSSYIIQNAQHTYNYAAQLWAFKYLLNQPASQENVQECLRYFKCLIREDQELFYDAFLLHSALLKTNVSKIKPDFFYDACDYALSHQLQHVEDTISHIIWHKDAHSAPMVQVLTHGRYNCVYKSFINSSVSNKNILVTKAAMMVQRGVKSKSVMKLFVTHKEVVPFFIACCARMVENADWQVKLGNFFWNIKEECFGLDIDPKIKDKFLRSIVEDPTIKEVMFGGGKKIDTRLRLALIGIKAQLLGIQSDDKEYTHNNDTVRLKEINSLEYVLSAMQVRNVTPDLKEYHAALHAQCMSIRLQSGTYDENKKALERNLDNGFDFTYILLRDAHSKKLTAGVHTKRLTDQEAQVKDILSFIEAKDKSKFSKDTFLYAGLCYLDCVEEKNEKQLQFNKDQAFFYLKKAAQTGVVIAWDRLIPLAFEKKDYVSLYECAKNVCAQNSDNRLIALQRDLLRLRCIGDLTYVPNNNDREFLDALNKAKVEEISVYELKSFFVLSSYFIKSWALVLGNDTYDNDCHKEIAINMQEAYAMWYMLEKHQNDFNITEIIPPKVLVYCERVIKEYCDSNSSSTHYDQDIIMNALLVLLMQAECGFYVDMKLITKGLAYCVAQKQNDPTHLLDVLRCWQREIHLSNPRCPIQDEYVSILSFTPSDSIDAGSVLARLLSNDILYRQAMRSSRYALLSFLERNSDCLQRILMGKPLSFVDTLPIGFNTKKLSMQELVQWQRMREGSFFENLCFLADNKEDPVVSMRAARILLCYETAHNHQLNVKKNSLDLIKKYSAQLAHYYKGKNITLEKEVQACMKDAIRFGLIASSTDQKKEATDFCITLFTTIKSGAFEKAYELLDQLEKKQIVSPLFYVFKGVLAAQAKSDFNECILNLERARQIQVHFSVHDKMWIKYVEQSVKQFVWNSVQKMMQDKKDFTQGDFDAIACAAFLNAHEKTIEERRVLLECGKFKNAHCSWLYASLLLDNRVKDISQIQDWETRREVYALLKYALMQGQRSLGSAATIDFATHSEVLQFFENCSSKGDLGSAILLASAANNKHDKAKFLMECPINISEKNTFTCDCHITELINVARESGVVEVLEQLIKEQDSVGPLAYFRLFSSLVSLSELKNNKEEYNLDLIKKVLHYGLFYLTAHKYTGKQRACVRQYIKQLAEFGAQKDPKDAFFKVICEKLRD